MGVYHGRYIGRLYRKKNLSGRYVVSNKNVTKNIRQMIKCLVKPTQIKLINKIKEHLWCRASGIDFTARDTWFNLRCGQIGSSQCRVRFRSGMRRSPSESNGKLLTYIA
jgi:hypothetical protein